MFEAGGPALAARPNRAAARLMLRAPPLLAALALILGATGWTTAAPIGGPDRTTPATDRAAHAIAPLDRAALQAPLPSGGLASSRWSPLPDSRGRHCSDPHPRTSVRARPNPASEAIGASARRAPGASRQRLLPALACFSLGTPPPQP